MQYCIDIVEKSEADKLENDLSQVALKILSQWQDLALEQYLLKKLGGDKHREIYGHVAIGL